MMRLVIALIVLFSLVAILAGGRFRVQPGGLATVAMGAFSLTTRSSAGALLLTARSRRENGDDPRAQLSYEDAVVGTR